jgi:hypothetical protein
LSQYVKATNFTAKDGLPSGNPGKIVKGTEIDTELTAIASAISSKADSNSPSFTGTPTVPTAAAGTNTTQAASTAFVSTAITNLGTIGTMAAQNANAVAITGGSVTGITDLVVADGGTGVSTIPANAVVLGNGTSPIQTVAPGANGNILTSNGTTWTSATPATIRGLGLGGEVWNNVTGSRSFNTPYTNNRSYPIAVSASTVAAGPSPYVDVYVGGVRVSFFLWQFNGAGAIGGCSPVIVPPGATYQLNSNAGLSSWAELY